MDHKLATDLVEYMADIIKNEHYIKISNDINGRGNPLSIEKTTLPSQFTNKEKVISFLEAGALFQQHTFPDWLSAKLMTGFTLNQTIENQRTLNQALNFMWLDTFRAMSWLNYSARDLINILENTEVGVVNCVQPQEQLTYFVGLNKICEFVKKECKTYEQVQALKTYLVKREAGIDDNNAQSLVHTINTLFPEHLKLFSELQCIHAFSESQKNNTIWNEIDNTINLSLNLKNVSYRYLIEGYKLSDYQNILELMKKPLLENEFGILDIVITHINDDNKYLNTYLCFHLDSSSTLTASNFKSLVENTVHHIYQYHGVSNLINKSHPHMEENMTEVIEKYINRYAFNYKLEQTLPINDSNIIKKMKI